MGTYINTPLVPAGEIAENPATMRDPNGKAWC